MPAFVRRHDQEPGADSKSNEREVRIRETDPVHIVARRAMRQRSNLRVAAEKTIEDRGIGLRRGGDLLGSASTPRCRRRLNVIPDEPPAEPSWRDLLDRARRASRQGVRDRLDICLVRHGQVLEALTDAPLVRARFPVDLIWRKRLRQLHRACAGLVELGHEPDAPTRQRFARCNGHVVTVT